MSTRGWGVTSKTKFLERMFNLVSPKRSALGRQDTEVGGMK